jgi:hypothetical protein
MFDITSWFKPNKNDVVRKGPWHQCKYNWEAHACRIHDTPWGEQEIEWEDGVKTYFYKDKSDTEPGVVLDRTSNKWIKVEQATGNVVWYGAQQKNKITWVKNKIVKYERPRIKAFNYVCGRFGRVQAKYDDRLDVADGTLEVEDVVYNAKYYKADLPKDNLVVTIEPDPEYPRWELTNGGTLLKENNPLDGREYEANCRWGLPIVGW